MGKKYVFLTQNGAQMEPKRSQNGAQIEENVRKNDYKIRSISRHRFFINFNDFGAIFGVLFAHISVFFPSIRKRADMRFDCAMASGLRVGPPKIDPKTTKNHSKIDLEKRHAQK
jgi:hypothetical protein